jgi:hypothetical protein
VYFLVYKGLGVSEVWLWQEGKLREQKLQANAYMSALRCTLLPDLDLDLMAEYIRPEDEPQAVKAFRNIIRG